MFLDTTTPLVSIGIDPGKSTGFAIYSLEEKRLTIIETLDFWLTFNRVVALPPGFISRVVVEVPDTKHVWQEAAQSTKALQRQGINIGSVLREAALLADGLERRGYTVVRANPRKKIKADVFKKYTGWRGRTNQHERDAAMLCYGR